MDSRNKKAIKKIERHLRNYRTYKAGVYNLQQQLDYIMPSMTATYDLSEGSSGTFNITSATENYAIDRIESRRALVIHEDIERYNLIIKSIDKALAELEDLERQFIITRYFENESIEVTSKHLRRSEKTIFNLKKEAMQKLIISLKGLIQF